MCYRKTTTLTIIVGVLNMIRKRTDKHAYKMAGSPSRYDLQNTAFCGTVPLLRRILSMGLEK